MKLTELAPPYIRSIAAYQPGKPISDVARELGLAEADIVKLASNENPLGPSKKAIAAIQAALPDLALYPDGGGYALKVAIAKKFGVTMEQIILGNGSISTSMPSARRATPRRPGTRIDVSRASATVPARKPGSSICASTMTPSSTSAARHSPMPSS